MQLARRKWCPPALILAATVWAASAIQHDASGGHEPYRTLLGEIEATLGAEQRQAIERRLAAIEATIRPMYASMPKNEHEKLGPSIAGYMLHRVFMLQGWSVRGLGSADEGRGAGSPIRALQDHLPDDLYSLLDRQLTGEGFDLGDVAVVVALVKQLVRGEMVQRLHAAYKANRVRKESTLSLHQVQDIFDAFMASLIAGRSLSGLRVAEVQQLVQLTRELYQFWGQGRVFVHAIQRRLLGNRKLTLPVLELVAEEIGEQVGVWRKAECLRRKRELMAVEDRGSGRVRLADFYGLALHDEKPQFGESVEYLRQVGSLDSSNPNNLLVIIPNWVASMSNCFGGSNLYSLCCISECEELLGEFEREFERPNATPAEVAAFAASLPSGSVPAGRTLQASLVRRLHEMAGRHGGRVPLHVPIFAQWLHHAYPRECPCPHPPGTTSSLRADEWEELTGKHAEASDEEMQEHIDRRHVSPPRRGGAGEEERDFAPWRESEELF